MNVPPPQPACPPTEFTENKQLTGNPWAPAPEILTCSDFNPKCEKKDSNMHDSRTGQNFFVMPYDIPVFFSISD